MAEITVPVTVGKKVDVTVALRHSTKSVLFINKKGQAHMVPEDMALNYEKGNKGHIIDKSHKDYMPLYKMAVGFDDKVGTKKFMQIGGKVVSSDESGVINLNDIVAKEAIEAAKAQKEAGNK